VEGTCARETRAATDWDNGTASPSCHCVDLFRARHQFDFRRLSHSHRCAAGEAPHFDLQNYATGDWFGLRNTLYDYGIEITGGYTTEPAGNPVGGIEHGFTYLHNFGFGVLFDLQKIAGISDTTFLVTISQRSGRGLTQDAIGNAISVQQIFGGGQTESMKNSQKISIEFPLVSDAAVPKPTRDRLRQVETDAAPVGARKVRTTISRR